MRTSTHAARRLGGRTLAAASLVSVVAVGGTATLAQADQVDAPTEAAVAAEAAQQAAAEQAAAAAQAVQQEQAVEVEQGRLTALKAKVDKVRTLRTKVVEIAKDQVGDRYRTGSQGPDAFDCSGLVAYVYKKAMGKALPHQSRSQYGKVEKIKEKDARAGDLVFFFRNGAHHVGVYIGAGRMVHAKGVGRGVQVSPIHGSWYSRTFTGFGRIIADPVAA